MAQPTQSDVHVDAVLTNISVAYQQEQNHFIATQVFPAVSVAKQTDKYFTYTKADWMRDEARLRTDSTESAGSGYTLSTATYSCDVYALHKDVGDQVRANADAPLNVDRDATLFLSQRLMLRQEIQFVTDAFTTSVWGTDITPTVWSNYATSTPVTDVDTGKTTILKNTGYMPNTLVLGYEVFAQLRNHPDIIDRIKYSSNAANPAVATESALAAVFGIERVLVAKAIKNSAVENETASYAFTHGKNALLCYSNPSPSLLQPSAGYTFVWSGVSQGMGTNVGVKNFRIEEKATTRIEAQMAWDNKIVATDLGYFFASVVS